MSQRNPSRRPPRSRAVRPQLDPMESRRLLAIITVTGTGDGIAVDGVVTLREAITAANTDAASGDAPAGSPGMDEIDFNIPGPGVHTITLTDNLPTITEPLTIDGYTQPGASPNTGAIDQPDNADLRIQLDASKQIVGAGLLVDAGNCVIRGLSITNIAFFGSSIGIRLNPTSGGDRIEGNFLGVAPDGKTAGSVDIGVQDQGPNNTIGGELPADRNVLSGNKTIGISSESATSTNTLIQGNFIGVQADGVDALPNGAGVGISLASGATIGGAAAADRNVISANNGYALTVFGGSARIDGTVIQGNYFGVDRTGAAALPNFGGITLSEADHTMVGGTAAGEGNVILATNTVGIEVGISGGAIGTVIQGNAIGTDRTGTLTTGVQTAGIEATNSTQTLIGGTVPGAGNLIAYTRPFGILGVGVYTAASGVSILGNSIFGNGASGIYGAQSLPPVLTSVTATAVAGHFQGKASTLYHVEYFATPATGGASAEQGETLLGTRDATSDSAGHLDLAFSPAGGIPAGQHITATATDPAGTTSGFSTTTTSAPPPPASADLATTLAVSPGTTTPGGTLVYTITVTNNGPDAADDVTLQSAIPSASLSFVSFTAPADWATLTPPVGDPSSRVSATAATLAPGAAHAAVFRLVVRVPSAAAAGSITDAFSASTVSNDTDAANNKATATVTVATTATAPPAGTAPTAVGDAYSTSAGHTLSIPARGILANDAGMGPLSASVLAGPTHGRLAANPDGSFLYTPDPGFAGVDGFTYVASDGRLSSAPARVVITVAATPVSSPPAVDPTGPRVVLLQRFGYHDQPTLFVLTFDEALSAVGTSDLSNYTLTAPGRDGRLGTRDDVTIPLKSATYDPATQTVHLAPRRLVPWRSHYQLVVRGLTDAAGYRLDGDGDGKPGGDAVIRFDRRVLAGPSTIPRRVQPQASKSPGRHR